MAFQVQGKVYKIFDTEQIKETFQKRVVVLEYASNPMYPQYISFEFLQNSVTAPDNVQEGQMAVVEFDLSGREWTSPQGEVKYFNSLRAWKIMPAEQMQGQPVQGQPMQQQPMQQPAQPQQPAQQQPQQHQPAQPQQPAQDEPEDDLPF